MWRNIMRLTKSKKVLVLHYSIEYRYRYRYKLLFGIAPSNKNLRSIMRKLKKYG